MTDSEKLNKIINILKEYESLIEEAIEEDMEFLGANPCEADTVFRPLAKEIRDVIKSK